MITLIEVFLAHSIILFVLFILVEVKQIGGKSLLAIGALVDIAYNLVWATLLFWQWPREVFFTQRVSKNKLLNGYRGKLASFICTNLLNRFLPNHCKG